MECLKCKCARYIFCWDCIPIPAELKGEKYSHLLVLTLMATTIILFLSPAMEPFSRSLPCCYNNSTSVVEECEVSANTVVILRLSFAFVIFHSLVFLLELYLKMDPERLSRMRRGFWCSKMTFIALMCYMCVFIKPRAFDEFWAIALMLGANVFIVVQLYTLIRLAYLIVIMLQKKVDRGSKPAHQIQIALLISGILLSIISESLLILYYPFCSLNVICLIINAVIPSLACLWTVSDCVRARNGYSGFLHGSILCCFVQYWTWSAISSNPDSECSPYTHIHEPLSLFNVLGVIWTFIIYIINTNYTYEVYVDDVDESIPIQKEISENASESDRNKEENAEGSQNQKRVHNNLFCVFIRGPLLCFIVMTLLEWTPQSTQKEEDKRNNLAFWFKLFACWISILFFITTLYTPGLYGIRRKRTSLDTN